MGALAALDLEGYRYENLETTNTPCKCYVVRTPSTDTRLRARAATAGLFRLRALLGVIIGARAPSSTLGLRHHLGLAFISTSSPHPHTRTPSPINHTFIIASIQPRAKARPHFIILTLTLTLTLILRLRLSYHCYYYYHYYYH